MTVGTVPACRCFASDARMTSLGSVTSMRSGCVGGAFCSSSTTWDAMGGGTGWVGGGHLSTFIFSFSSALHERFFLFTSVCDARMTLTSLTRMMRSPIFNLATAAGPFSSMTLIKWTTPCGGGWKRGCGEGGGLSAGAAVWRR